MGVCLFARCIASHRIARSIAVPDALFRFFLSLSRPFLPFSPLLASAPDRRSRLLFPSPSRANRQIGYIRHHSDFVVFVSRMSCLPCVSSVFTHEPIVHVICKALVKNSFSQHASSCSRDSGGGDGGGDKHLSFTSNTATGHENHENNIMNLALINKAFANTMRTYRSLTDRLRKNKPKDNNAAKTTNKRQTTTATQTQGKHSQKLKEDVIAMMERAHTNLVKNKTLTTSTREGET